MNLSRCQKGHFYDAEKYTSCPHCAGGGDTALTSAFTDDLTVPNDEFVQGIQSTPSPAPAPAPAPIPFNAAPAPAPMPQPSMNFPVANIPADQLTVGQNVAGESLTVPLTQPMQSMPMPEPADMTDDGHTVGFFGDLEDSSFGAAPVKAQAEEKAKPSIKIGSPCVGWLIALGGNHFGTDFRLKAGKNYIGRSEKMDIALTKDSTVSREKHAIVVYEPREHMYIVQPGEASTLVYKNESVVLEPTRLEAYDVINVGNVNLLFIPLCNKEFNWSDIIEEKKKNNEL